jgi:DNA-binding NarL/FixJ family response regulator
MSSADSLGASSVPPPEAPPLSIHRIVIVKWDVLAGDTLSRIARGVYPQAEVLLHRTGADALDALRRRPAALGLFGLTLPDIDGLDLLGLVADERLAQRRMIVTGRRDEYSRQALQVARVQGVFDTFAEDGASLAAAIRTVGEGGEYFSASLARGATPPGSATQSPFPARGLTLIEQQIFMIMTEGASDQQIGRRLGMAPETVGYHRASILKKTGVTSSEELLVFARSGLNKRH